VQVDGDDNATLLLRHWSCFYVFCNVTERRGSHGELGILLSGWGRPISECLECLAGFFTGDFCGT